MEFESFNHSLCYRVVRTRLQQIATGRHGGFCPGNGSMFLHWAGQTFDGQQQVCQLPWQVADRRPNGRGSMRSMALGDSECALVMLDSSIIFSMTMLFTWKGHLLLFLAAAMATLNFVPTGPTIVTSVAAACMCNWIDLFRRFTWSFCGRFLGSFGDAGVLFLAIQFDWGRHCNSCCQRCKRWKLSFCCKKLVQNLSTIHL